LRITDRATEIAEVVDLDERQTGMLLVIRAESAIIRATPFDRGVVNIRHLRRLDKDFAAATIIINIIGNQDFFRAVLRASLEHEDIAILKDNLTFDLAITGRTD